MPQVVRLDELLAKVERLPPLPKVCLQLRDLFDDPKCSAKAVAALIEKDALLASTVLKLANSAVFSAPGGVSSILRAVQMMGFSSIHQVVLCAVSSSLMQQAGNAPPQWMTSHTQAVSVVTTWLATSLKLPGKEIAPAAGLLHDIGRLAALVLIPDATTSYADAIRAGAAHSLELERELLGANHELLGAMVGLHWKYPPALIAFIEQHHTADPTQPSALADAVAVADAWAWSMGFTGFEPGAPIALDPARAARLGVGLTPTDQQRTTLLELINAGAR